MNNSLAPKWDTLGAKEAALIHRLGNEFWRALGESTGNRGLTQVYRAS